MLYHYMYDRMVKRSRSAHIVKDYYPITAMFGLACDCSPRLNASAKEPYHKNTSLCLHVGAVNAKRRMPVNLIIEIIEYAKSRGIQVRLVGTETELARQVIDLSGGYPAYELTGVKTVKTWLSQSDLVIAPDSGILHLAAALDKTCIAVYGPNTFERSGPLSDKVRVIELDYDCRPCIQKHPCPYDIRCMKHIRFEAIREAMDRCLAEPLRF
jgi:heptosyltransferase-2